jgi:hypothetical protein
LGRAAHFLVEPEDELEGEHPKITLEQIMGEKRNKISPIGNSPYFLVYGK